MHAPDPDGIELAGRLLVATPQLEDPNFARTVIRIISHDDEGTLGVVLNRPSTTRVAEVAEAWAPWAAEPGLVFLGGPVQLSYAIALSDRGLVDVNQDPTTLGDPPERVRLFAGSAGWSPGQLAAELEESSWWVVDGEPGDAFAGDPDELWRRVVRRQPGTVGWFANYPETLEAN